MCGGLRLRRPVLRKFASFSAALAGYTVAIVGGGLLGTVGRVDANATLLLAVSPATAICLGPGRAPLLTTTCKLRFRRGNRIGT